MGTVILPETDIVESLIVIFHILLPSLLILPYPFLEQAFIYELLQTPRWARADMYGYSRRGIRVSLDRFSMEWFIENKGQDNRSVAATQDQVFSAPYRLPSFQMICRLLHNGQEAYFPCE